MGKKGNVARTVIAKRKMETARMLAQGLSVPEIARKLDVSYVTIYRYMEDPALMEEYRNLLRRGQVQAVAKAQNLLIKQLDSNAASGYLAQNAAALITNRFAAAVMGEDKQEITINITSGMPEIGMPERTDEE